MTAPEGKDPALWLRLVNWLAALLCSHHWIRARWDDGSYGYRCMNCLRPYQRTWNQLLGPTRAPTAPVATLIEERRFRRPALVPVAAPDAAESDAYITARQAA